MSILSSILEVFGKGNRSFDPDLDNCYSVLLNSLAKHKNEDQRGVMLMNDLKKWKKLEVSKRLLGFSHLFLTTKAFLSRQSRLPDLFEESLDEKVRIALGKHLENERIGLIFKDEETQKHLLGKFFILEILENAKSILGSTGNDMLKKSIDFCNEFPIINYDRIDGLGLISAPNDNLSIVLKDFSYQIAKKLSNSFGDDRISGFYRKSHQKIRNQYSLLSAFPFILDLIPEKYLRFEDINELDNAYLRDALKKTVEQLTARNDEIRKKNETLERTERKLKSLTDRLQIINDIDKTILKSDSLDEFIYGTLDIIQTKLHLTNASLVFFDFDKRYYSEHLLENGKQSVSQKLLDNFRGNLSKLKNSEYDLILPLNDSSLKQKLYYPIIEQGELIASISFEKGEEEYFGKDFIDTIEELTGGMAISIVNRKLEQELRKRNKDMTDSLYYAQRIQNALIPSFANFNQLFNNSFVLFRPKDVVSGDFYWAHQTFDNRKIWITADCTGHGVPGAIMSVIGFNILNKVVIERGIWETDKILDELKENIIQTLSQKGEESQTKDGMDVSVCIYNPNRGTLQYSGALSPIFIVRKDSGNLKIPTNLAIKEHDDNLIELLPNKMPAAYFEGVDTPFTKTTIVVEEGDSIYSFTDGYSDQFGGERDKKFMVKNFRKLLSSIAYLDMKEQKKLLEEAFLTWKGDREQIDDVCVIGIKIDESPSF